MKPILEKSALFSVVLVTFLSAPLHVQASQAPAWDVTPTPWYLSTPYENTLGMADTLINQLMTDFSVSGLTVALLDAETGFSATLNFGDAAEDRAVSDDTLFNVASISKTFTALSILQLVDAGLIDLDEKVSTYLPDFSPTGAHLGEAVSADDITIRMLLSHTSGIFPDLLGYGKTTLGFADDRYFNQLPALLNEYPLLSEPFTTATYSNAGFDLLGHIVGSIVDAGNPFEGYLQYVNDHLLTPLVMNDASFVLTDAQFPQLANPYIMTDMPSELIIWNGLASGGLWTSSHDMLNFMQFALSDGTFNDQRLLSPEGMSLFHTVIDFDHFNDFLSFGLGTMRRVDVTNGLVTYGHGGNMVHHHSNVIWDQESALAVFVSTNSISGINVVDAISNTLLNAAVVEKTGQPLEAITIIAEPDSTPVALSQTELESYTGLFFASNVYYTTTATDHGTLEMTLFVLGNDPIISVLTPLSDGSFVDESGTRWSLREANGTRHWFLGAPGVFPFSTEVTADAFISAEDIAPYLGNFVGDNPEGEVSFIRSISFVLDDHGRPLMYTSELRGGTAVSPLVVPKRFDLDAFEDYTAINGFGHYIYDADGMAISFEFMGAQFVRAE